MKLTSILIPIILLVSIVLMTSMLSCGGSSGGVELTGTWTLTTIPDSPNPAVGDGTYTIGPPTPIEELETDYYSGTGVIGGVDYKVNISRKWNIDDDGNDFYLFLWEGTTLETDYIKFSGNLIDNFTTAGGVYIGQGTYSPYGTGIFSSIKQ